MNGVEQDAWSRLGVWLFGVGGIGSLLVRWALKRMDENAAENRRQHQMFIDHLMAENKSSKAELASNTAATNKLAEASLAHVEMTKEVAVEVRKLSAKRPRCNYPRKASP